MKMDKITRAEFFEMVESPEVEIYESNGQSGNYPDCEWVTITYTNGDTKEVAVIREA
jgi:hypothetical protein